MQCLCGGGRLVLRTDFPEIHEFPLILEEPKLKLKLKPRPEEIEEFVCITHHLIQEGDTYGLIYSLLVNEAFHVSDINLCGLFFVDDDDYSANRDGYQGKIDRRMGYFDSFRLRERGLIKLAKCVFTDKVKVMKFEPDRDGVVIFANSQIFGKNTRKVSIFLTGVENDPGKKGQRDSDKILGLIAEDAKEAQQQARSAFIECLRPALIGERRLLRPIVRFGYISYSTSYVLRCVNEVGAVKVAGHLRGAILGATREYTRENEVFLGDFMGKVFGKYLVKKQRLQQGSVPKIEAPKEDFIVVLFWIRGAKDSERDAIFKVEGTNVGKPQHHTNVGLYKYVRELVRRTAEATGRPYLFVPIGDELKDLAIDSTEYGYVKGSKENNLINFFRRTTFKDKPMGAQINFLLQFALNYKVIQVGMRSGSMERLMYLGVPTIYFDRTEIVEGLMNPVGDSRILDLCSFKKRSTPQLLDYCVDVIKRVSDKEPLSGGYPLFFHIENTDTGALKYAMFPNSREEKRINVLLARAKISREEFNDFTGHLKIKNFLHWMELEQNKFAIVSGLSDSEAALFTMMLWFIGEIQPYYEHLFKDSPAKLPIFFKQSKFVKQYYQRIEENEEAVRERIRARERRARENAQREREDGGVGFFDMFNSDDGNGE